MDGRIRAKLTKEMDAAQALGALCLGGLSLYALFPLVNLCRGCLGRWKVSPFFGRPDFVIPMLPIWRDYNFALIAVLLIFLLYACLKNRLPAGAAKPAPFSRLIGVFRRNPAYLFLLLLGFWMIVSTAVTGLVPESVIGSDRARTGLLMSLCFLLYFPAALGLREEKQARRFLAVFLIAAGLVNAAIVAEYYAGAHWNLCHTGIVFYNSNHLAYYLLVETVAAGLVFVLTDRKAQQWIALAIYLCGVASLLIANTLGCLVALVLSFVLTFIVLLLTKRFRAGRFLTLLLGAGAVFLALYLVPNAAGRTLKSKVLANLRVLDASAAALPNLGEASDSLGSGRMALWKCGFRSALEKPLFGCGLAEMRVRLSQATNGKVDSVHNEFLEYATNHGLPALASYLAFCLAVFIRGARRRLSLRPTQIISLCAAFAYLVSSFFGVTMFYTAPYLFILLGLGYSRDESGADAQENEKEAP